MIELLLPPVAGAFIGYVTNYIAVKMLFKPYKPYYLFGRRLPFTPGLIPSKRSKLADAIARAVKEDLLTEEVFRKRLNEEKIKNNLTQLVSRLLDRVLTDYNRHVNDIVKGVEGLPLDELVDFELVEVEIRKALEKLFSSLENRSLEELLPAPAFEEIERLVDGKVDEVSRGLLDVHPEELRQVVHKSVRKALSFVDTYIPVFGGRLACALADKLSTAVAGFIKDLSQEPQLRHKLSKLVWKKARELLSKKMFFTPEFRESVLQAVSSAVTSVKGRAVGEVPGVKTALFPVLAEAVRKAVEMHREKVSVFLSEKLLELIEIELPVIMESVDVEGIVRERVNALPVNEVEELILRLISDELRYITILGGVLGFLIGTFQLFFLR